MKTAVIVFPGSNCDRDLAVAIEQVTGRAPAMVWHRDTELPDGTSLIALPGGESAGDWNRARTSSKSQRPCPRCVMESSGSSINSASTTGASPSSDMNPALTVIRFTRNWGAACGALAAAGAPAS